MENGKSLHTLLASMGIRVEASSRIDPVAINFPPICFTFSNLILFLPIAIKISSSPPTKINNKNE